MDATPDSASADLRRSWMRKWIWLLNEIMELSCRWRRRRRPMVFYYWFDIDPGTGSSPEAVDLGGDRCQNCQWELFQWYTVVGVWPPPTTLSTIVGTVRLSSSQMFRFDAWPKEPANCLLSRTAFRLSPTFRSSRLQVGEMAEVRIFIANGGGGWDTREVLPCRTSHFLNMLQHSVGTDRARFPAWKRSDSVDLWWRRCFFFKLFFWSIGSILVRKRGREGSLNEDNSQVWEWETLNVTSHLLSSFCQTVVSSSHQRILSTLQVSLKA